MYEQMTVPWNDGIRDGVKTELLCDGLVKAPLYDIGFHVTCAPDYVHVKTFDIQEGWFSSVRMYFVMAVTIRSLPEDTVICGYVSTRGCNDEMTAVKAMRNIVGLSDASGSAVLTTIDHSPMFIFAPGQGYSSLCRISLSSFVK